ncbi:MAG: hypothetical protein GXW85_03365 [Clostridia bacterium]|nr:hypothetical protein [Clostridia bacterium]
MPYNNGDLQNYSRTKPLIRTVSNLKNVTNNLRMFADSFEQLLNSVENFVPTLEIAAKGKDLLVSKMVPPMRRPVRPNPKAAPKKVENVENPMESEDAKE